MFSRVSVTFCHIYRIFLWNTQSIFAENIKNSFDILCPSQTLQRKSPRRKRSPRANSDKKRAKDFWTLFKENSRLFSYPCKWSWKRCTFMVVWSVFIWSGVVSLCVQSEERVQTHLWLLQRHLTRRVPSGYWCLRSHVPHRRGGFYHHHLRFLGFWSEYRELHTTTKIQRKCGQDFWMQAFWSRASVQCRFMSVALEHKTGRKHNIQN